jgi:hypothetical protein
MPTTERCLVSQGGLQAKRPRPATIVERHEKAIVVQYEDGTRDRVPARRVKVVVERQVLVAKPEPTCVVVTTTTVPTTARDPIAKPAPAKRSSAFKEHIRRLACFNCSTIGRKQQYPTEADHEGERGVGLKTSDLLTIPLCTECHRWITDTYQLPFRYPASKATLRPREETEKMVRAHQRHLLMRVLEELSHEQAVQCLEVGLRNLTESELRSAIKGDW